MDSLQIIFLVITISFLGSIAHGEPITSCDQTPYPQVCHHFITSNNPLSPNHHSDQAHLNFRDLTLRVTINQAQEAHRLMSSPNSNPLLNNEQTKLALADCIDLYEDTASLLNQTNNNNINDVQTYLSAAIANQETCTNSFTDLGLPIHKLQSFPIFKNFSMLLSNALAVNRAASERKPGTVPHGRRRLLSHFPTWLPVSDRKLLKGTPVANIVVAKDGSGKFVTINDAIKALHESREESNARFVIHVKAGVYDENIEIKKKVKNLMLFGDGIDKTIITDSKSVADGFTTFRSATVAAVGDGFIARDITFENTAGPQKHQAVALRSGSDFSVFYRCSFKGYQDTLYAHSKRQFYRDCEIYGTVDFIFGDAAAVIQNSHIYVRRPMENQKNTITAQRRKDPNENTGIVIHKSIITASADLKPVQNSFETYLGRPWKEYSRTVIMKSTLDSLIQPQGWLPWAGNFALDTLYYGEYSNTGDGASTERRVKWKGYHVIDDPAVAEQFTAGNFIAAGEWIPKSGVPFINGL